MTRRPRPLSVVVYQDVVCALCFVADQRLQIVRRELGEQIAWKTRAFPLRAGESPPSAAELQSRLDDVAVARSTPEGSALTADLWTSGDPPHSSLPALAAVEAARLQGEPAHAAMVRALRRAALEQGVNVGRSDALFELASTAGLDMNRFSAAFLSPQTRRLVLSGLRHARERGVRSAPTVVIGGRWMLCGLRETAEYREHLLLCLHQVERARTGAANQAVH